jgi:large subunit ribosomal protein L4
MELTIYTREGSESGNKAELSDAIFGIEPHEVAVYEDVRRIQAHRRSGTASTKERGEVRGGGRKAHRQKGTGMARRGSIRSPLLKGGGTTFGPKPHDYKLNIPKKVRKLARRSAFSDKAEKDQIMITEDFTFRGPKTKKIKEILDDLNIDYNNDKVLILTPGYDKDVYLSGRNMQKVHVMEVEKSNTYDVLNADVVLLQESALETLQNILEPETDETAA